MTMLMAIAGAGGNLAPAGGWDISTASFDGTPRNFFNVASQSPIPTSLAFSADGTKMYVLNASNGNYAVYQYSLSTAWDVSSASYVQSFSVSAQDTNPRGLFFVPDGSGMYVVGATGDAVNEYLLSTAWDISTASYAQNFSIAGQETSPTGVFFKSDGTKMYVIGSFGDDVNEYSLSTAWDISTASYVQNFSVATEETFPSDLFFKSDGTKMYVIGSDGDDVNEYSLSTAWDVSTASYVQNFSVATQDTSPQDLFFKSDGTKMYIVGSASDTVYQYSLSTAWDISTASFTYPTSDYFSVAAQEGAPSSLSFKPDGTKMYVIGTANDNVREYDLSTAWNISTASYVQFFSVSAQETSPSGLFFKDDGTKMYICGLTGDDVNEYNLSTAWNISTASYVQNFSVAVQDTEPNGLFFKSDGTKMYVLGNAGDDVNEYSLSTAWDISTASYAQNFSVATEETSPLDLFFKPDGTKMYVIGNAGDDVNEYSLSTAWDISTASYSQNFSVSAQASGPTGLFFKSDGTKMYIIGNISDAVWAYNLS